VYPTKELKSLLASIQPWVLVQAYFDDAPIGKEHSIRLVPARALAVERTKTITYNGIRVKTSTELDYSDAVFQALQAPRIAIKERFLVYDQGRAWLLDHFIETGDLVVETEFETKTQMDSLKSLPIWIHGDLTGEPKGYTRNRAYPHALAQMQKAIEFAAEYGSREEYMPGEHDFSWATGPHSPSTPRRSG
jgi:CYTH domain-containing protein